MQHYTQRRNKMKNFLGDLIGLASIFGMAYGLMLIGYGWGL